MSTLAIAPDERIKVRVDAVCHTCKVRHKIDTDVPGFHRASWDWYAKHDPRTHEIEFLSTDRRLPKGLDDRVYSRADVEPWFLTYRENADIKIAYAAAATFALGLHATPLASSSTFAADRESTAINNTSNKYIDYKVAGKVTTGTSPTTAKSIRIYAYSAVDDTPTYPDTIDGTDSDETLTSAELLAALGFLGSTSTTLLLIGRPDRLAHEIRVPFIQQVDRTDLAPKSFDVLHRQVKEIGGPGLGANNSPALVYSVFKQREKSFATQMPWRFGAADYQIPDIGIGCDVADDLLNANAFSLEGARKGRTTLHAYPDQILNIWWNILLIVDQDDGDGDWRVVVAAQVTAILRRIVDMGLHF